MFISTRDLIPLALQICFGAFLYYIESTGKFQLAYSKFRKGGGISARAGMFFIYFPAPIAYAIAIIIPGLRSSTYHDALFYAFAIHFGKRCLEILFLHKYSRPMGLGTVLLVSFAYSAVGWSLGSTHYTVPKSVGNSPEILYTLVPGLLIFAVGQMINLYHHWILAALRGPGNTSYQIPDRGWFKYAACPHYFGEIVSWFGFAIASGFLGTFGIAIIMTLYLAGRAKKTREWYLANVPGYPSSRGLLLPIPSRN